ncbi:DUF4249 domain-containing protein [Spirosoma areae]
MRLSILLFGLLVALFIGCVDTFNPTFRPNTDLIVVNGIVTDLNERQTISLSRTRSSLDSNISTPLQRATVMVVVDGATTLPLLEIEPGTYGFPTGFRGKVGQTYQLRFTTEPGVSYQSSVETMLPVPPILKAYDQFNLQGVKPTAGSAPIPSNDIYIDFQDPAGERNFYFWRWRLYESQVWCATCEQGRYQIQDIGPVGSGPLNVLGCVRDTTLGLYNLFDYPCRGLCWDIFYSTDTDVFTDVYSNGALQVGHKVASIPIYQRDPALLVIEQLSVSVNAYRYYKLFTDQTQNTGTLADSPPAPTSGNVTNPDNPSESVVGYFSAASVAVKRYRINRNNVTTGQFQGLFQAQQRRRPNLDNARGGSSALCIPSRTRTDLLPEGL